MSGLLFLTSSDFSLQKGTKGNILCNSIPGFSLILFYSTQCNYCKTFIPIFKKLPTSVGCCQFGMINVSHNKNCILMSRNSISPISVVPYVILYVNGRPYMRYQGPQDIKEISRFIIDVSKSLTGKTKNLKLEKRVKQDVKGSIPAYTIGQPLCGPDDKVCYLEFNSAYNEDKNMKQMKQNSRLRQKLPYGAGM